MSSRPRHGRNLEMSLACPKCVLECLAHVAHNGLPVGLNVARDAVEGHWAQKLATWNAMGCSTGKWRDCVHERMHACRRSIQPKFNTMIRIQNSACNRFQNSEIMQETRDAWGQHAIDASRGARRARVAHARLVGARGAFGRCWRRAGTSPPRRPAIEMSLACPKCVLECLAHVAHNGLPVGLKNVLSIWGQIDSGI
jgi:hypothetical protein